MATRMKLNIWSSDELQAVHALLALMEANAVSRLQPPERKVLTGFSRRMYGRGFRDPVKLRVLCRTMGLIV